MTPAGWAAMFGILLRLVAVVLGFVLVWQGYRLYASGLKGRVGNLEASWGDKKFVLQHGAPGTFLAVAGALVMIAAIITAKGIKSDHSGKVVRTTVDSAGKPTMIVESTWVISDTGAAATDTTEEASAE